MDGDTRMLGVTVTGLAEMQDFLALAPQATKRAARLAINDTTRRTAVPRSVEEMNALVAFPAGYLTDKNRFQITRLATEDNLEAAVVARQRPTSLARFTTGGSVGKAGVRVRVSPRGSRSMGRAFLIRLPQGRVLTEEAFNLGLAIRLKPGEQFVNKKEVVAKAMGRGLYLLYGPSVDQVFRSVSQDISPEIAEELSRQFFRQFARLTGGRDG